MFCVAGVFTVDVGDTVYHSSPQHSTAATVLSPVTLSGITSAPTATTTTTTIIPSSVSPSLHSTASSLHDSVLSSSARHDLSSDDIDPFQPQIIADDSVSDVISAIPDKFVVDNGNVSRPESPDPYSLNINYANMTPIELPALKSKPRRSSDYSSFDDNTNAASETDDLKRTSADGVTDVSASKFSENSNEYLQEDSKLNVNTDLFNETSSGDAINEVQLFMPATASKINMENTQLKESLSTEVDDDTNEFASDNALYSIKNDTSFEEDEKRDTKVRTAKSSEKLLRRLSVPSSIADNITSKNSHNYEISRSSSQSGVSLGQSTSNANIATTITTAAIGRCDLMGGSSSQSSINLTGSLAYIENGGGTLSNDNSVSGSMSSLGGGRGMLRHRRDGSDGSSVGAGMVRGGSVKEKRVTSGAEDDWERKLCGRRSSEYYSKQLMYIYCQ